MNLIRISLLVLAAVVLNVAATGYTSRYCSVAYIRYGAARTAYRVRVGRTYTYACRSGYSLVGTATIQCTSSGWAKRAPYCSRVTVGKCRRSGRVRYGSLRPYRSWYTAGTSVTYTCRRGYALTGQSILTCQSNSSWSHNRPTCTRIVIKCPAISGPANGLTKPIISRPVSIGTRVWFKCSSGFQRVGAADGICLRNGSWSVAVPTCQRTCSRPDNVLLASFSPSQAFYSVASNVTYTCSNGYTISGEATLTCLPNGQWSHDEPTCTRITLNCPVISAPENGSIEPVITRPVSAETSVTFSCDVGYEIFGAGDSECQHGGAWSNDVPTCEPIQCPAPGDIENGSFDPASGPYGIEQTVEYTCSGNYVLEGQAVLTCLDTGLWSHDEPECVAPVTCSVPVEPANGAYSPIQDEYFVNNVVTFTCDDGYTTTDRDAIICRDDGTWSSDEPVCNAITCDRPDDIDFGSLTTPGNTFNIGATATYVCNAGYEIVGQDVLTCTVSGEWSDDEPTCSRIVTCQTPVGPSDGSFTPTQQPFFVNSEVTFTCDDGFILNGESVITCQDSGLWSDPEPTCDPIQCPAPGDIENGSFDPASGPYGIEQTVEYTCSGNYVLEGQSVLTCLDTGLWSHDEPECVAPVTCSVPVEPANGAYSPIQDEYFVNNVVTFTCDDGYTTTDRAAIICRDDGTWSSDEPVCNAITCDRPDDIDFGSLTTPGNTFNIGATATYVCNAGYEIVGQDVLTCTVSGEWSDDEPTCSRIVTCQTPVGPSDGSFTPTQQPFFVNSEVTFICDDGFILSGESVITCQDSGLWSDPEPTCDPIQCPAPGDIENGSFDPASGPYGIEQTVEYTCNGNYVLEGQAVLTCLDTGLWSHDEPECVAPVTCPTPDAPVNGVVTPIQNEYLVNVVIWYTCDAGYTTTGRTDAICRDDGTWSSEAPICAGLTCDRPDDIDFGSLTTPGNTFNVGATATYVCNAGYEIVGQDVLTCTVSGEWSDDEPTCQRVVVQCAARAAPAFGSLSPSKSTYAENEVVTFSCNHGYNLSGESQSTCQASGQWDEEVPTCVQAGPTCAGRCGAYDSQASCQCDYICFYYDNCCSDYNNICV
ncbi:sushi, von Willebrand factor type A, EGF and pentraxin domain-containing protein 1-like isoform X2 [Ciona intestinalis]